MSQHIDVDLNILEYNTISESVECLILNVETLHEMAALSKELSITIEHEGCINAIPYWFQYKMLKDDEHVLSTFSKDSNVNQAVMLVEPVQLKPKDNAILRVNYQNGIIKLTLLPNSDVLK